MTERIEPLVGTWFGEGLAEYPTIEAEKYTERLTFVRDKDTRLFYEQVAWRESGELLHHESGFVIDGEKGLQILNSQGSGRVEVMDGTVEQNGEAVVMRFESTMFGNDPRLLAARRIITIEGGQLRYEQFMTIEAHPQDAVHLSATLNK